MSCGGISKRSRVAPRDIGSLLGAIAARICEESRVYVFGSGCAEVDLRGEGSTLSRAERIARKDVGCATYAHRVLDRLTEEGISARRLLIFTDMQIYGEGPEAEEDVPFTPLLREYRRGLSPGLRTYIFNLQPYEHFMTPADEHGVSYFSGWNERLLRYVDADSGDNGASLVERVDAMVL